MGNKSSKNEPLPSPPKNEDQIIKWNKVEMKNRIIDSNEKLDLSQNYLGRDGLILNLRVLEAYKTYTEIDLSQNNISKKKNQKSKKKKKKNYQKNMKYNIK